MRFCLTSNSPSRISLAMLFAAAIYVCAFSCAGNLSAEEASQLLDRQLDKQCGDKQCGDKQSGDKQSDDSSEVLNRIPKLCRLFDSAPVRSSSKAKLAGASACRECKRGTCTLGPVDELKSFDTKVDAADSKCGFDHWDEQAAIEVVEQNAQLNANVQVKSVGEQTHGEQINCEQTNCEQTQREQAQRVRALKEKLRERSQHNRVLSGMVLPATATLCTGVRGANVGKVASGCQATKVRPSLERACLNDGSHAVSTFPVQEVSRLEAVQEELDTTDELLEACREIESADDLSRAIAMIIERSSNQPGGKQIARVLTVLAVSRYESMQQLQLMEMQMEISKELIAAKIEQAQMQAQMESQEQLVEIAREAIDAVFSYAQVNQAAPGIPASRGPTLSSPGGVVNPYTGSYRSFTGVPPVSFASPYAQSPAYHSPFYPSSSGWHPSQQQTGTASNTPQYVPRPFTPQTPTMSTPNMSTPNMLPPNAIQPTKLPRTLSPNSSPDNLPPAIAPAAHGAVPPSVHLPDDHQVMPNTNDNQASAKRYSMPVHQDAQSARLARSIEAVRGPAFAQEHIAALPAQPESNDDSSVDRFASPTIR